MSGDSAERGKRTNGQGNGENTAEAADLGIQVGSGRKGIQKEN